ncbi:MAG: hypothetical protein JXR97_08195 [Planctomycetes bacterium]|nr:hypothetical protein [Planctomycetota bacterium]
MEYVKAGMTIGLCLLFYAENLLPLVRQGCWLVMCRWICQVMRKINLFDNNAL